MNAHGGNYEICYNGNSQPEKHRWSNTTLKGVLSVLGPLYKNVAEVVKQIDTGDVISYRNLRVRRKDMQQD